MKTPDESIDWFIEVMNNATKPLPPERIKELAKIMVLGNPKVFPDGWVERGDVRDSRAKQ